MGQSEWMVVEADESDGTFTKLPCHRRGGNKHRPRTSDHYGDYDPIKAAFRQFIENIPFYGFAVLCTDHPAVQAMIPELQDRIIITYGFNPQADVRADEPAQRTRTAQPLTLPFAANVGGDEELILRDVFLPMLGHHNVSNALSALAIARRMGMAPASMKNALANFSGVKRRFTKTGEIGGITVIDDYGHHPVEIQAVLESRTPSCRQNRWPRHRRDATTPLFPPAFSLQRFLHLL